MLSGIKTITKLTKNNRLHIVIFDGSFATTAFINRLIKGLAINHEVYVLGFNERLTDKLKHVHYVPLGSNQNKLRFFITSLSYAIKQGGIKSFFKTFEQIIKGERKQVQEQNLRFVLHKIQPDVIHLQWPSVIPLFEEVLLKRQFPIVLSQRGYHNNVRPFIDKENFQYLGKWYPKIAGFHSVSKAISFNGDLIWNSPEKTNRVVYTGLPFKEFLFSKEYQLSKPLKLIAVGRTHWKKGYDYALQTCKILRDRNLPFHFTIIGGAGDEELQFLIADLELQGYVSLEGRMPQKEVFQRMREASVLLMPSVEEGIPNVAVEAMAFGLPVISTDCGGVPELIEDGEEGWVVPMRDPEAMAEAVIAFSRLSLEEIEKVRIAGRRKVELQHNEEQMIRGMEGLYREILERFRAEDKGFLAESAEFSAEKVEGL